MINHLTSLLTPDRARWQPMLMGLACFAAGAGGAVLFQSQALVSAILTLLALGAWVVGACAAIGYVRWLFASEMAQAKRDGEKR